MKKFPSYSKLQLVVVHFDFWDCSHAIPMQRPYFTKISYHRNVSLAVYLPILYFSFCQKTNLHLYERAAIVIVDFFPPIQYQNILSQQVSIFETASNDAQIDLTFFIFCRCNMQDVLKLSVSDVIVSQNSSNRDIKLLFFWQDYTFTCSLCAKMHLLLREGAIKNEPNEIYSIV